MSLIDEFNLTDEEIERLRSGVNDLNDQADFYDMAIDHETASLLPYTEDTVPTWLRRWQDSREAMDFDERTDMEREDQ